ncbi:phytoene desaturase family protein [Caldilinea sp.]|uniref:phytoene desaturase family protein n=1 Tax=Caldilinea sp. TaxID=2293560 RepID=UPI0021DD76D4|nr:NAD(P)/FAD-dependent oxidoreductase [Caldilinea sp.]GIV68772.1 MAG: amine oxidase [Caldilinea sp.]
MTQLEPIVVIGAGVGGLTTAALLAKAGCDVTVLEAHVYPGGCAGTFFHKNYRFEAGATLAGGFYPGGPMDIVARALDIASWPARADEPAMVVHLPDGQTIARYGDERRWEEYRRAFGETGETFFRWQEACADALWDLALRAPAWPPQSPGEVASLVRDGLAWLAADLRRRLHPPLLADAFRPVAAHLQNAPHALCLFVDAQLLIAAQTTSAYANALYGAAALDLPRRGVVHLQGGIGAIAETLVDAVRRHGGKVLLRQEVERIVYEKGEPTAVVTKRGERFPARTVVANLPPWNIARLMGDHAPEALRRLPENPEPGWGAFTVYVGFDAGIVEPDAPLHHQVIEREPLGEGNSIFLSLSPDWDESRAPRGRRALTISTHTALDPWWKLFRFDRRRYEQRKAHYLERILRSAERVLPGLRAHADLILPGTPVTFQRFTRRMRGWVGGFPQTSLFRTWGPRLDRSLWMVGDSIFPGQSTAAVALGGLRVARAILAEAGAPDAVAAHRLSAANAPASEAA